MKGADWDGFTGPGFIIIANIRREPDLLSPPMSEVTKAESCVGKCINSSSDSCPLITCSISERQNLQKNQVGIFPNSEQSFSDEYYHAIFFCKAIIDCNSSFLYNSVCHHTSSRKTAKDRLTQNKQVKAILHGIKLKAESVHRKN